MPGFGDGDDEAEGRRSGDRARPGGGGPGRPGEGHRIAFPGPPRRTKALAITLAILVLLIVGFLLFTQVYTNVLWFRSVGFGSVYRTRLTTQISLFIIF